MSPLNLPPEYAPIENALTINKNCKVLPPYNSNRITYTANEVLVLLSNTTGKYVWGYIGTQEDNYYALLVIHCPTKSSNIIRSLSSFNALWCYHYFNPEKFFCENEFSICSSRSKAITTLAAMINNFTLQTYYPFIF